MEWIGCVRCEKSRRDSVARACALTAPVHTILHRVSCSYEKIPNAPKHYTTHQNMSLGSNGADWVRSLWKIPTWLHGTNFYFNCTSSPCFASSLMPLRNDPKCIQTLCNAPKHVFRVQWGGLGVFVEKYPDVTSWQELSHQLHQFTQFCVEFHVVTKQSQMHPNTMQHTKTCVLGPIGWIGCIRRQKSRHDFLARTFALIAPVHPVCIEFHVVTKRSQMLPNTMRRTKTWV